MDATASVILAEQLRAWGLSVINVDDQTVSVTNQLNLALVEGVGALDGRYVTGWGYELGEAGDEPGAAQRLAYLLGLLGDAYARGTETRR
ncbi:hypothetical protein QF035_002371 [Streptomyces umbrinus]|uniref:Uncharacterized protein n=1 Tax=Streptomyces umbrinus TaxID=67370 RepID=A0ABU0SQI8_9ACTN|nr:hypothetical protein [Streptomyces umbrinus]MDQ1024789.1 hypothetical protein [Streptomyces umbrinus]